MKHDPSKGKLEQPVHAFKSYVSQHYPLSLKTFLLVLEYSEAADFTNFHTFLNLLNSPMIIAEVCHISGCKFSKTKTESYDLLQRIKEQKGRTALTQMPDQTTFSIFPKATAFHLEMQRVRFASPSSSSLLPAGPSDGFW